MIKNIILMRGVLGLNNVADPKRLHFDITNKRPELAEAVNIQIDDTFRPERRGGATAISAGVYRDLHQNNWNMLVVKNDWLTHIDRHMNETPLLLVADIPMFYANIGNATYFNNGLNRGIYSAGIVDPWEKMSYRGAETTEHYDGPPRGSILCYFRGVMYMAMDNIVFGSMPFRTDLWNYAKWMIPFSSKVLSINGIENCLYVSDEYGIYAHVGDGFRNYQQKKVWDSPAITGTVKMARGFAEGKDALIFATEDGLCAGFGDGSFTSLTEEKISISGRTIGSAYINKTHYVCSTR